MQVIPGNPSWRLNDRQHHESYESDRLLPELPLIGRMRLLDALPAALQPHSHEGKFEVHFVVDGCLSFTARDQEFDVHGGMVFLTKPGEIHGGVDAALQPAEWFWAHLQFPADAALPGLTRAATAELERAYLDASLCLFPGSDRLRDCFAELLAEHQSPRAHGELVARALFHELLVRLIREHDSALQSSDLSGISPEIREAITWLDKNLGDPLSIPDLAENAGLSQSHFRKRFHRETGFTPGDYLNRRRVIRAKSLLWDDSLSVTEIAFQLGFQSSPYFAAVFKKFTGFTPTEYRDRKGLAEPEPRHR